MKFFLSVLFTTFIFSASAQSHVLVKLWETPANIAVPESVLPHKGKLYISLIDGKGWDDDGNGGIGVMNPDGTNYNGTWITGLSAPKGMGVIGNKLYVADITRVVVIDIKKGAIIKTIPVPGSENLNDITIGKKVVYISDSKAGKIWQLKKDQPSLYLDNAPRTNGLKFIKKELYYGEGRNLKKISKKGQITTVAALPQEIDGIEQLKNGDFIVTSWPGYIFYVYADGRYETLLETHKQGINTADIGLDRANNIIYVPTFNGKTVVAYQVR